MQLTLFRNLQQQLDIFFGLFSGIVRKMSDYLVKFSAKKSERSGFSG